MDGPPIRGGAVLVAATGRVAAVGPDAAVPVPAEAEALDWPDAVLLPGLVNAHTHLELTGLAGRVPEDDFAAWIRRVRALKEERTPAVFLDAARAGLAACHAAGVTTVAETGDSGAVMQALAEAGGSGIVYQEVFGPHPDQRDASVRWLEERVAALAPLASARVRLGLSPHAPYTVSGPLYEAVARMARERDLPLAVHLAESRAETDLLGTATGSFAAAWAGRGIPLPSVPGRTPVEWLDQHGVLGPRTLCIHLVQVSAGDIARVAAHGCAVAHCPRSNRRHGHGDAPLAALLGAGLRVGVGTDSEASLPPDLLAEARAARALARLDAAAALALCTSGAARALGLEGEVGVLAPGAWGDVAVIGVAPDATDPVEAVLASSPADVRATYLAGRRVHPR